MEGDSSKALLPREPPRRAEAGPSGTGCLGEARRRQRHLRARCLQEQVTSVIKPPLFWGQTSLGLSVRAHLRSLGTGRGGWSVPGAVQPAPTWESESSSVCRAAELQHEHLTVLLQGVLKTTLALS